MILHQWRERLSYTVMSAFVAWQTVAIVVAPAPDDSALVKSVHTAFQPYLDLFRLDNQWNFFAPNIAGNSVFRYVIKDSSGVGHTFMPITKWSWFHPNSIWFHDWYDTVMDESDTYGEAFGKVLCKEHAELKPVSVVFLDVKEQDFRPEDLLEGKHPLDPEFVEVTPIKTVECPTQ